MELRAQVATFRDELGRMGWPDGAAHVEECWATDDLDRVRTDAAEVVKLGPDIIFSTRRRMGSILQEQTRAIPSAFVGISNPLGQGLVPSLARPAGEGQFRLPANECALAYVLHQCSANSYSVAHVWIGVSRTGTRVRREL